MKLVRFFILSLALLCALTSCIKDTQGLPEKGATTMKELSIKGTTFVDLDGNEVILSGINLVCKDKAKGYVENVTEQDFKDFKDLGFNLIRFGLIWDGVEPNPTKYDVAYLAKLKEQIKLAEKYGIYVFLDMHQDLYSVLYSDGAPEWATITEGLPHIQGEVWSDAYLISPAVNKAIDNFWGNYEVNGVGLQDYYTDMWKFVADYFKDCDNIIGFDIMNEPYPGSVGQEVLGGIVYGYAQKFMPDSQLSEEELAQLWFNDETRVQILADMANMDVYSELLSYAKAPNLAFEKDILSPFFDMAAKKIAEVAPDKFIMTGTSYFCNMAIESGLQRLPNAKNQVYAPHGYDLVVDTNHYDIYNQNRVDLIFATHKTTQTRLNTPTIVGEWGAFTSHPITYELTKDLIQIFEENLWSNTYWAWYRGYDSHPYVKALHRAYPQAVSGELLNYHYDFENATFSMEFTPSKGKTRIFYPNISTLLSSNIVFPIDCTIEFIKYKDSNAGIIEIEHDSADMPIIIRIK